MTGIDYAMLQDHQIDPSPAKQHNSPSKPQFGRDTERKMGRESDIDAFGRGEVPSSSNSLQAKNISDPSLYTSVRFSFLQATHSVELRAMIECHIPQFLRACRISKRRFDVGLRI